MDRNSAVLCQGIAGLLGIAIMCAMPGFCAPNNTVREDKHDDRPPQQRPTRETIPDDVPPDIRKLMEDLLSGDPKYRVEAIINTKRLGQRAALLMPYLIENLGNPGTVSVGQMASRALRNDDLCELAVEPLIAALGIKEYKGDRQIHILSLLSFIEDRRAVPALIAALEDEYMEVRLQAAYALIRMPDKRAFKPLMRRLHDKDDVVVSAAIQALGEIGDRRAVEPIIALLLKTPESPGSGVRRNAAEALGKLGDPLAFDALLATYKAEENKEHPDSLLRDNALTALGRTKDPRAFEVLHRALTKNKSFTDWERRAAVWGLAGLGDERSIKLLKRILTDERPIGKWWDGKTGRRRMSWIRVDAARALVATGDKGAINAVWEEYKRSPETSIDTDKIDIDRPFRLAAVDALAMSPKPQAYLKIIDILDGTDVWMRGEAVRVLYCSTLSQALFDRDIVRYARRKLPALDDMRVLQALMKVAESKPPEQASQSTIEVYGYVRKNALAALRKSKNPDAFKFVEKMEKVYGTSESKNPPSNQSIKQ